MFSFSKKLFEPVYKNKLVSSKTFMESSLGFFWFDILPIFTIPYFINLINNKDWVKFEEMSLYLCLALFVLWTIHFFIRKWDFEAKAVYTYWVEKNYRKKIILKDNLVSDILGTGKTQSVVMKGMTTWVDTAWEIWYQVPKMIFTIIAGILVFKNFGSIFIVAFLFFFFVSAFGFYYFRKLKLYYDEKVNRIDDEKNADSVRVIMSRVEVLFSGKEDVEVNRLAEYSKKSWNIWKVSLKYDFLSDWFISGFSSLLPIVGVLVLIYSGKVETLETGIIITFVYFASRFAFNMYSMLWIIRKALDSHPVINTFFKFIEEVPEIKNYNNGKKFVHGKGDINFINVNFRYEKLSKFVTNFANQENNNETENEGMDNEEKKVEENILDNFNLNIVGGTKVALIGKSGSGKTTLAKLASGYLTPTSGNIFIDGQDLNDLNLKSYYKYIGYLTQEPQIFDGTIKENLLYAKVDAEKIKEDDILTALRQANCDFVFKMPKGLRTQIGERGIRLSGGERQRLAIAKLFLKDPEIIILDEPTSALDSFSEELITKSLEQLFFGRTVLIIAHRLQTVRRADRILVLENGKIIEDGDHASLIQQNGHYAEMLNMQSGF